MPLIKPLASDANEDVVELAKFFNETLGFCPNSVLTMQHRPAIAKAFINLNMAVMENKARVTAEQKRLIGYLTSANTGCRYCEAHTILAAERYGGTEDRLANIWS
ncbi:MAG: carboxymuconolactone decarboxylase family protein, partial [Colwelliaceae bacterium]|nr:carboxymuconolactone decarboxylase family protein [Colwelliaceae bacterium]